MRRALFILAILLTATSAVRADLSFEIGSFGQHAIISSSDASSSRVLSAVAEWHALSSDITAGLSGWASVEPPAAIPGQVPASSRGLREWVPSEEDEIIQVPPPPSSDRLAFTGLLTVLMGSTLRSARHLRFGALPAWFQTAGPDQIGHRVALEWGPGTPLPACQFDSPSDGPPCPVHLDWVISPPFLVHTHLIPIVVGPRAPPT
jgi:hypothetical protein